MKPHRHIIVLSLAAASLMGSTTLAHAANFKETLAYAYHNHPALHAAEQNAEAVNDRVWEAYSGFLPTAVANYERGRKKFEFDGTPEQYTDTETRSLSVTQPIFRGGGTIAQIGVAESESDAEQARLFGVGQDVLLNAVTAYVRMVEAQQLLQINRDNIDALTRHMDATRARRQAKDLTVTDVSLSEARLARAQADMSSAESALDAARAAYEREIGMKPDVAELPAVPTELLPKSEEEAISQASNHPALIAARHREEAADSTIDARLSTLLPTVSLQGVVERREGISTVSTALSDMDESAVTLRVSVPLYQSGAEYARLSQARHQYQSARNVTTDTIRFTSENATRAWADYMAAVGGVEAYERAVKAANHALASIREEYKYGARTVLDLLDTQQETIAARSGLIRAETQRIINAYQLLAATGRLEPATLGLPLKETAEKSVAENKQ